MRKIWAIGDLHLSFGVREKDMGLLNPDWAGYTTKLEIFWKENVSPQDLVLIPGDISWAMKIEDAAIDLQWIDSLPGTKVMIKGNHDYWWGSLSKIIPHLPPSIHLIQNNAFHLEEIAIGGARLWDTDEYSFSKFVDFKENPRAKAKDPVQDDLQEKIFLRELERLRLSLKAMNKEAKIKICMTHYPPISADLQESRASKIFEEFGIEVVVFGHLHSLKKGLPMFGKKNNIEYALTSADFLDFRLLQIR